jgi:dipeptidyl aminopeptidase/acylaminoacyl peptidase
VYKDKKIGLEYLKENEKKDYSPALSRIDFPILVLHGKKDETVPLEFSRELVRKYKNLKLIELSSDHKFEDYLDQQRLIRETVRWIKNHL